MIPLIDLKAQYLSIKNEIDEAINECISDGIFINGKSVSDFENAFSEYLGANYCIGCANGTDALEIILRSLKIGHGDEVIVPALTWISTAEAVSNAGGEPVFVDVSHDTYTIDINKIEEKITNRTKAIIPVHLYGYPAELTELKQIAEKYNLYLVEDCAQAHGAEYSGKKTGTFGIASAFSFFPSKNLGAFGDAGAVVTDNKELADLIRKIGNHGQLGVKHKHFMTGRNSRLDTMQAAVLKVKLKYLDTWNNRRKQIASEYHSRLLENHELHLPYIGQDKKHVFHLFVIRTKQREKVTEFFKRNNISWGIHYPNPLPFLDAYRYKNHKLADFPSSVKVTSEIISIPLYPEMTENQIGLVCEQLLKCS